METHTFQARFASQEQAEAAVRKLAALRGDRFRVERVGSFPQSGMTGGANASADGLSAVGMSENEMPTYSGVMAASEAASPEWGAGTEEAQAASFTLSAQVPAASAEQVRSVILGAGGEMI
jgi:hypothetical protein